jgi:O-antigen/teichoic acid export membrane protein
MSSFKRSILSYSSAMIFCRFVAIVQGLVIMRWMPPEALGPWFGLQLISVYGAHAHLGILNAVNRQIPFHRGRQELAEAENVEQVARGAILIMTLIGLVVVGIMAISGMLGSVYGRGVVALTFCAVIALGVQFHLGLFRARQQFGLAGWGNVANAAVILFGLPLVYYLRYDGLLWRISAASVFALVICLAMNRWDLRVRFSWSETLRLVRIGAPIMVVVLTLAAFSSMDRTLILLRLDAEAMGLYGICFSIARVMALVPNTIGQLFYPRMTELYGAKGFCKGLVRRCLQASAMSGVAAASAAIGAVLTLPWVVNSFFPRYADGLPALRVAMIAYTIFALAAGPTYFLIATVQKRRQLVAVALGALSMIGIAYGIAPQSLVGIAWSLVGGTVIYIGGLWMIVIASSRRAARIAA